MPKFLKIFFKWQKKYMIIFLLIATFTSVLVVWRSFQFWWTLNSLQKSIKQWNFDVFVYSRWFLVWTELLLFFIRVVREFIKVKYRWYMNIHARVFWVEHAIEMNYQNIARLWSWKLLQIIHSWMESYSFVFYELIPQIIETFILFGAIVIVLSSQTIWFLLFFIVWFLLVILAQKYWFKKLKERRINDVNLNENYVKQTAKILMNFILLKVFWIKKQEMIKLENIWRKRVDNYIWIKFWFSNIARVWNLLMILAFFIAIFVFWKMYMQWRVSMNIVMMMFFLMAFGRRYFYATGIKIAELSEKLTYIKRYDDVVSEWKKQKLNSWIFVDNLNFNIWFEHVFFSYDGQKELLFDDFSLHIPKWQKLAIVWKSWSWKSTIFKLLTRMIEIKKWDIKIWKHSINKLSYETIFKNIWLFRQEPLIFDWTVEENLTLHTESDKKLLKKTLDRVWLDYLWLDNVIWERWVLLSWWEKQRLALARIFLFNFDILLLDEPTANLDEELEEKILKDIFETYKNKTIIIISHRPFILDYVDRIITVRKWEIVEDLMK